MGSNTQPEQGPTVSSEQPLGLLAKADADGFWAISKDMERIIQSGLLEYLHDRAYQGLLPEWQVEMLKVALQPPMKDGAPVKGKMTCEQILAASSLDTYEWTWGSLSESRRTGAQAQGQ